MAASHSAVLTGGNSPATCRVSIPGVSSGMAPLLDYFQKIPESGCLRRLGMHEKHRRTPRPRPRTRIDQLESVRLHVIVRRADIPHTQRDVRQSAAPAVLFDLFGYRRFLIQRLNQLDQVGTVAHLHQHLAYLILPEHVLAMD